MAHATLLELIPLPSGSVFAGHQCLRQLENRPRSVGILSRAEASAGSKSGEFGACTYSTNGRISRIRVIDDEVIKTENLPHWTLIAGLTVVDMVMDSTVEGSNRQNVLVAPDEVVNHPVMVGYRVAVHWHCDDDVNPNPGDVLASVLTCRCSKSRVTRIRRVG